MNGELHGAIDITDCLIVFPLKDEGRARLIGTVRTDAAQQDDRLSWDDVSQRVIEWMRIEVPDRPRLPTGHGPGNREARRTVSS